MCFNEKTASKVLTFLKCIAKPILHSLVLEFFLSCMSGKEVSTRKGTKCFLVFVSFQTWNFCYLQWKIRSNTGKKLSHWNSSAAEKKSEIIENSFTWRFKEQRLSTVKFSDTVNSVLGTNGISATSFMFLWSLPEVAFQICLILSMPEA